ncbi:hypothetical protein Q7P37_010962 [Cladosporium fusiforme]
MVRFIWCKLFTSVLAVRLAASEHGKIDTNDAPQVATKNGGVIIGHTAGSDPKVFEFLGIRYAKAPVGELRFAAPVRYESGANSTFVASSWNADCPANIPPETKFPNFTGNGLSIINQFTARLGNEQNEDCLALNIWTRSIAERSSHTPGKPVFVFFHGGRFTIPGPNSPFYNGKYLANSEDVVVVTVNYRLGIFGFSGAPGIEQNVGLRDQRSAVEWLRDNVAGFGGDPERIIIFGQSAGGAAVDYWAYAYQRDPIVAGIISHSGTALSFVPNSVNYSRSIYNNVSVAVGCGNDTGSLACLRSKNVAEILAAARNVPALPTQALAQATFHPTVDNITVFEDYTALGLSGSFAKIPYLAGHGDYEAGFCRISAFNANVTLTPDQWDLYNQRAFVCPTKYANDFRVLHAVPTWRFLYKGAFDNLRLYNSSGLYRDSGAYHGADLSELFGTAQVVSGDASTFVQNQVSRYMQGAWAAFGRDPEHGLNKYGWPAYNSSHPSLVELAPGDDLIRDIVDPASYDDPCPPVERNDPRPGRGAF